MRTDAESTPRFMTPTGRQFYLITKPCWNLGTPQMQSSEHFSPCNWWGHLSSAHENLLLWLTSCSDPPLDKHPRATCLKRPLLKIHTRVVKVVDAQQCLGCFFSQCVVQPLVTVAAEDNCDWRWHFHKSSGHARGSQLLWGQASAVKHQHPQVHGQWSSAGNGSASGIPPCHPHPACWHQESLGSLMLPDASQDLGMTMGQQFFGRFCKNLAPKPLIWLLS